MVAVVKGCAHMSQQMAVTGMLQQLCAYSPSTTTSRRQYRFDREQNISNMLEYVCNLSGGDGLVRNVVQSALCCYCWGYYRMPAKHLATLCSNN
jgi:hypothetical protein